MDKTTEMRRFSGIFENKVPINEQNVLSSLCMKILLSAIIGSQITMLYYISRILNDQISHFFQTLNACLMANLLFFKKLSNTSRSKICLSISLIVFS
jgi:hypothetical protein